MKKYEIDEKDIEYHKGYIWISKILNTEKRGNIYLKNNGEYHVMAYITPEQYEQGTLDEIIRSISDANGTLWMLE